MFGAGSNDADIKPAIRPHAHPWLSFVVALRRQKSETQTRVCSALGPTTPTPTRNPPPTLTLAEFCRRFATPRARKPKPGYVRRLVQRRQHQNAAMPHSHPWLSFVVALRRQESGDQTRVIFGPTTPTPKPRNAPLSPLAEFCRRLVTSIPEPETDCPFTIH